MGKWVAGGLGESGISGASRENRVCGKEEEGTQRKQETGRKLLRKVI